MNRTAEAACRRGDGSGRSYKQESRSKDGDKTLTFSLGSRSRINDSVSDSQEKRYRPSSPRGYGDSAVRSPHLISSRIHYSREYDGFRSQERVNHKSISGARNAETNVLSFDGLDEVNEQNIEGKAEILPELYSIQKGKVRSIRAYGVFVKLYNYRGNGLVHLSQISNHEITKKDDTDEQKVQAITSVVEEGEEVWVKVISLKHEEDGSVKIGCSLKYVSQTDGRDLDPTNVQYEQLRSRPTWQAPQKLSLDAIYNVTCSRCGGHGHLKKECYSTGDKVYELLTEEDMAEIQDPGSSNMINHNGMIDAITSSSLRCDIGTERLPQRMERDGVEQKKRERRQHSSKSTKRSHLPDMVTTVEEALAVIASLEGEKRRDKERRKEKKKKVHKHREEKKQKGKEKA